MQFGSVHSAMLSAKPRTNLGTAGAGIALSRHLLLLNGLSILAVVSNHAVSWGLIAMFWWADRFRPVSVPNYDQLGTLPYYVLVAVKQLTIFSVPAFLFVSGFFVAYAARGSQRAFTWRMAWMRIQKLLTAYIIWSLVLFAVQALEGSTYTPVGYLERLVSGEATPAYYFVPLLCQFYLLSPLLIALARDRWRLLLAGSLILQLAAIGLHYLDLARAVSHASLLDHVLVVPLPNWFFPQWCFLFVFGLVSGFHLEKLKQWLANYRPVLLAGAIVFALLSIAESEVASRLTGQDLHGSLWMMTANLYSLCVVTSYLAFSAIPIPFSPMLYQLGAQSFGIYLVHPLVLEFVARAIYHLAPQSLAYHGLFALLLIVLGVGIPVLAMPAFARSPARKSYHYLFG